MSGWGGVGCIEVLRLRPCRLACGSLRGSAQDDGVLREFGNGGDEAVGFVEDEFFDEGLRGWLRMTILRWFVVRCTCFVVGWGGMYPRG